MPELPEWLAFPEARQPAQLAGSQGPQVGLRAALPDRPEALPVRWAEWELALAEPVPESRN